VAVRHALFVVVALVGGCAHTTPAVKRGPGLAMEPKLRLAAVMWPNGHSAIYCTRRLDDYGKPVGVAGPCRRLEAGETDTVKILSWATLGRFDNTPPDAVPSSLGGRCTIEITQGKKDAPATLTWVTPSRREELDRWTLDPNSYADAFTSEASFAPEGEWMILLHVTVGLGDGERIIEVPSVRMIKVPACS
jgi:hypothetical protein